MSALGRKLPFGSWPEWVASAELFRCDLRFELRQFSLVSAHGPLVLRLRSFEFDKRLVRRRPLLLPLPNEFLIGAYELVHPPLLLRDLC